MNINIFLKYQYNLKIRPRINEDLKLISKFLEEKYPFYASSDEVHLVNALKWLINANLTVNEQGLPSKFSLGANFGLGPSYPETTGYTLNTLLTILRNRPLKEFDYGLVSRLLESCYRYLLTEQLEGGAFTGGHKEQANYEKPSVFSTGQILLGLADTYAMFQENPEEVTFVNKESLENVLFSAGQFLSDQIEKDGSYSINHTYSKSKRSYYSRASYGLLQTGIVLKHAPFIEKARTNFQWVSECQKQNGIFSFWGFNDSLSVLHTIAYTLRGQIEAANYFNNQEYLEGVLKGIDFLIRNTDVDFKYKELIPSHFEDSGKHTNCLCVTGLSQLAIILKKIPENHRSEQHDLLFESIVQKSKRFQMRGFRNSLLNGVMPASYPINGIYHGNNFIEWGTKFFMDTLLLSMGISQDEIRG